MSAELRALFEGSTDGERWVDELKEFVRCD
jgi:hypothetical protein